MAILYKKGGRAKKLAAADARFKELKKAGVTYKDYGDGTYDLMDAKGNAMHGEQQGIRTDAGLWNMGQKDRYMNKQLGRMFAADAQNQKDISAKKKSDADAAAKIKANADVVAAKNGKNGKDGKNGKNGKNGTGSDPDSKETNPEVVPNTAPGDDSDIVHNEALTPIKYIPVSGVDEMESNLMAMPEHKRVYTNKLYNLNLRNTAKELGMEDVFNKAIPSSYWSNTRASTIDMPGVVLGNDNQERFNNEALSSISDKISKETSPLGSSNSSYNKYYNAYNKIDGIEDLMPFEQYVAMRDSNQYSDAEENYLHNRAKWMHPNETLKPEWGVSRRSRIARENQEMLKALDKKNGTVGLKANGGCLNMKLKPKRK